LKFPERCTGKPQQFQADGREARTTVAAHNLENSQEEDTTMQINISNNNLISDL